MEKNKITKEILENNGYRKHAPSRFDGEFVVARYQKRFDDEIGKKYYIDVIEWEFPPDVHTDYLRFEFETQLTKDEAPMNIKLFGAQWSIKGAENMIEEIWRNQGMDYYARWDEE